MKRALAIAAWLACVGVASADALSDGQAGLQALADGKYDKAVTLLTQALKSGQLSPDLQELAYFSRGKAYAALHKKTLAIADLRHALALNPSDAEAQEAMTAAGGGGAHAAPARRAPNSAWGVLAGLAGRTWLETGGPTGRWLTFAWERPNEVLSVTGMDQDGYPVMGEYRLDPNSGAITDLTVSRGSSVSLDVSLTEGGFVEEGVRKDGRYRVTSTAHGGGVFDQTAEALSGNDWKVVSTYRLVETSPEVIAALGWRKAPAKPGVIQFLKRLGAATTDGIASGLHDGAQQRAQQAVAPKKAGASQ